MGDGELVGWLVAACVVLGLVIGSFLNVVIWRVPRGESVAHPPSACPRCGQRIRRRDNVPVVSWLLLRGRCRDCGNPISARYPMVEAGTGVLFGLTAWFAGPSWVLPALLYFAAIGVALTMIDLDTHRLPDAIVLPAYPVSIALLAVASWDPTGEPDWASFTRALIGGAILFAAYLLMVVVYPAGMGLGDVKLAGVVGLYLGWFGWGALFVGGFSAFLLGGLFSVALMILGRAGRKSGIPFGPWLLLGGAVGIVIGELAWQAYVDIF